MHVLALLGAAAACTREPPPPPPPPPYVPELFPAPIGPVDVLPPPTLTEEIRKRDSFAAAMNRLGATAAEIDEVKGVFVPLFDFRRSQPGHTLDLRRDVEGRVAWLRYSAGPTTVLHAYRDAGGRLEGVKADIRVETSTVFVRGEISSSLYGAMEAAGEQAQLTLSFVDLFVWDIDFFTETQPGDTFRILVEKRWVDGRLLGYGRVLGAEYQMAAGKRFRAFFYTHLDGTAGYYTEDGTAVRKAFLKSPIQFASITSRFALRRHPILEYVSMHKGVDYGAPAGTAIWAVGDGVVAFAGPRGGYGNVVMIKHPNGLETRYAHMRAFGSGIKAGRRVAQKTVIGYVGSTGLSTGPHLHFEVLRNGKHMNPLSVAVPPAPPVPEAERARFAESIAPLSTWIATGTVATARTSTAP